MEPCGTTRTVNSTRSRWFFSEDLAEVHLLISNVDRVWVDENKLYILGSHQSCYIIPFPPLYISHTKKAFSCIKELQMRTTTGGQPHCMRVQTWDTTDTHIKANAAQRCSNKKYMTRLIDATHTKITLLNIAHVAVQRQDQHSHITTTAAHLTAKVILDM